VGGAVRPPGCCEHAAARAAIACALTVFLLAGCYKRSVLPQSEGHLTTPAAKPALADIPPPARISSFVPEPTPAPKPPTYSVVVNEVPVKELLLALARDTKQNIDIHPGLSGLVSMNAINETLPAILDRVARQVNLRYRIEGNTIVISTDTPYMKTYKVNYVNMTRDTTSSIGVSGQIEAGGAGASPAGGGAGGALNASNTVVKTVSTHNFWDTLRDNIRAILASTRSQTLTSEDRAQRAEAQRTAREERLQQAEAVSRAGTAATQLFSAAFGGATQPPLPGDARDDIVVNAAAGVISVLANEKQHALVQQHLDNIAQSTQRQVLIEATIAEVTLSDQYQAGIDWQRLAITGGVTFTQLFRSAGDFAAGSLAIGYANTQSSLGNISATVQLLNQFGNTRVLSSPKLMALNNQTALLKVVDNVVYFSVQAQQGVTTGTVTTAATFTTTALTVPVGMVMSLTPQINENGQVTLTARPTVSRVLRFKNDPNPNLCNAERTKCVVSQVPEIQIREMESVLQLVSGQTAILGGLMQDDIRYDRNAVPGAGDLPNLGELFGFRNDKITKTELVIFLRSTVITNPSLDSDELRFFQRLLPQQTETPTHTVPGEKVEKAGATQ
jgi:general secretion pathway protein D